MRDDWIQLKREGGDLNPRALSSIGLAIQRLAWLGHLRFRVREGVYRS